jgi:aldehyde dehydrogenase (NAD+)
MRAPPESREIVTLRERYGHFVGGEWLEPKETYTTIDPSSEEPLAEVGQATDKEVGLAVEAAREAFQNGWSSLAGAERAKYLFRIARILQERAREFAVLESLKGGKPIRESRGVESLRCRALLLLRLLGRQAQYAFRTGSRTVSTSLTRSSPGISRS